LLRLLGHEGLGSDGFLLTEQNDEIIGFCWTRVHENGDGEIYRIAVPPIRQGRGLGRSLVLAGFEHLSGHCDLRRGTLWVDRDNERAVALYASLGMTQDSVNREFLKPKTVN
jgi:mycothiol synthase